MPACSALLAALAFHAALPLPARADEPTLPRGRVLVVGGERGQWWPLETALTLADEHRELAATRELVTQYEAQLGLLRAQLATKDKRAASLELASGLSEARAQACIHTLDTAEARASQAERTAHEADATLHAWWRHPALWTVVGIAVGAVAGVTIARR